MKLKNTKKGKKIQDPSEYQLIPVSILGLRLKKIKHLEKRTSAFEISKLQKECERSEGF